MPQAKLQGTSGNDVLNIVHDTPKLIFGNGGNDVFHFEKHGVDFPHHRGGGDHNTDFYKVMDYSQGDTIDLSDLGVDLSDVSVREKGPTTEIKVSVDDGHDLNIKLLGAGFELSDLIF